MKTVKDLKDLLNGLDSSFDDKVVILYAEREEGHDFFNGVLGAEDAEEELYNAGGSFSDSMYDDPRDFVVLY